MIVRMVSEPEFFSVFPNPRTLYDSKSFVDVNKSSAHSLRFFIGDDEGEPCIGIIMGYNNGQWRSPFSAPFGMLAFKNVPGIEVVYDFISELSDNLEESPIAITLPPAFYDPETLTAIYGVWANSAHKTVWDFNYHYPLEQLYSFKDYFDRSALKNYNRAMEAGFAFEKTADIEKAYAVISQNRESKGYPLAMTLEQIEHTVRPIGPVDADFFLLKQGEKDVASAMVYTSAEGIAQVIYWGDAPGYSQLRPMNILPIHIFKYYEQRGYRIVDVGPASKRGLPNIGLCRFKKSIGCRLSLKPTFIWD